MLNYLVLTDGSVASFVTLVGQEKFYVFLMCSLEKYFHFPEKFRKSH